MIQKTFLEKIDEKGSELIIVLFIYFVAIFASLCADILNIFLNLKRR